MSNDDGFIDIGSDHFIRFSSYQDDDKTGITVLHKDKSGATCRGWVAFRGGAWEKAFVASAQPIQAWDVQSLDPLTISPSVLCRACGDHGFIRDGKWVCA